MVDERRLKEVLLALDGKVHPEVQVRPVITQADIQPPPPKMAKKKKLKRADDSTRQRFLAHMLEQGIREFGYADLKKFLSSLGQSSSYFQLRRMRDEGLVTDANNRGRYIILGTPLTQEEIHAST
jgi:hypothetical protein